MSLIQLVLQLYSSQKLSHTKERHFCGCGANVSWHMAFPILFLCIFAFGKNAPIRDSDGHHNLSSFPHLVNLLPASLACPPPAHPPGWWAQCNAEKTIFKNHTQAPRGLAPPKTCQTTAKTLWKIGLQNQTVRRVYMWAPGYWLKPYDESEPIDEFLRSFECSRTMKGADVNTKNWVLHYWEEVLNKWAIDWMRITHKRTSKS